MSVYRPLSRYYLRELYVLSPNRFGIDQVIRFILLIFAIPISTSCHLFAEHVRVKIECQLVESDRQSALVRGNTNLPAGTEIGVCMRAVKTNQLQGWDGVTLDETGAFELRIKPYANSFFQHGEYLVEFHVGNAKELLQKGFTFSGPAVRKVLGLFGTAPIKIEAKFKAVARLSEKDEILKRQKTFIEAIANELELQLAGYRRAKAAGIFTNYPKYPRHPRYKEFQTESWKRFGPLNEKIKQVELIEIEFELQQAHWITNELCGMIQGGMPKYDKEIEENILKSREEFRLKYFEERSEELDTLLANVREKLPQEDP